MQILSKNFIVKIFYNDTSIKKKISHIWSNSITFEFAIIYDSLDIVGFEAIPQFLESDKKKFFIEFIIFFEKSRKFGIELILDFSKKSGSTHSIIDLSYSSGSKYLFPPRNVV